MYIRETHKAPFNPQIAAIMKKIGSKKRTAFVVVTDPTPQRLASYWDGGSKDEYVGFNSAGARIPLVVSGHPFFEGDRGAWTPNDGDVLVSCGTFCGKPATPSITFYKAES